jgi:hypothetical protein
MEIFLWKLHCMEHMRYRKSRGWPIERYQYCARAVGKN